VSTWVQLGTDITTWQATLTACGSTTMYSPPAQYNKGSLSGGTLNITVPDCVNHLQFFDAMPDPGSTYKIIFTVAGTSTTPLIFESCPQSQCAINQTGTRTVVLLDENSYNYAAGTGAGDLFIDDTILGANLNGTNVGVNFVAGQHIWARASNQEQATGPKLTCNACTLWMFGYKTEHNGTILTLTAGSQAEVYGGEYLGNPGAGNPNGTTFVLNDASLFFTGTASTQCSPTGPGVCNYPAGNQWTNWVQETRGGVPRALTTPTGGGFPNTGVTQNMNTFFALGAAAPPAAVSVQIQGSRLQGVSIP
jgi:hypothetical protein